MCAIVVAFNNIYIYIYIYIYRTSHHPLYPHFPSWNISSQVRQWRPLTDTTAAERFLSQFTQATTMFNYCQLKEVEYTFSIGACAVHNNQYLRLILMRAVSWTGGISAGSVGVQELYPNLSLLPNCEHWILGYEYNRDITNYYAESVEMQRQGKITIIPQYRQGSEPVGTPIPKGNYNQSPLQIFTSSGQDDTISRDSYCSAEASS